jgi:DNA-3-methyladenine glycosylase II
MLTLAHAHLSKHCPLMRKLVKRFGPCRIEKRPGRSPTQALMEAVAHQQLNGTAANTILKRFRALVPGSTFPKPEEVLALTDEAMRGAGFSRAKILSLRDIAQKTLDGIVPSTRAIARMSDSEIIARLVEIRGVGQWTVEMLLIFQLGRPDVWPVDDFGMRNGYRIAHDLDELPKPKDILTPGERWKPFRSAAAWYFWRVADAARQEAKLKSK